MDQATPDSVSTAAMQAENSANGNQETPKKGLTFPPTRWSLIAKSKQGDEAAKALAELCKIYWTPVYCYVRSHGKKHHDAQDITQGFFAQLLERDDLAKVDEDRGRLRCFLVVAVKRYLINQGRRDGRLKRGAQYDHDSLDALESEGAEQVFLDEPVDGDTPETYFDKRWASTVLETALTSLKAEYESKDRGELFEAIHPLVSLRSSDGDMGAVAERLGMKVGAFRMAVFRLRQRYAEVLRHTVADTLTDRQQAEDELHHLLTVFEN